MLPKFFGQIASFLNRRFTLPGGVIRAVDFFNHEIAYKQKSNFELRRYKAILYLCRSEFIVSIAPELIKWCYRMLGESITNAMIRPTFYNHFCGGETEEEVGLKVRELEKGGLRVVIDFACECELDSSFPFYQQDPALLPYSPDSHLSQLCDENMEGVLQSIVALGGGERRDHMSAVKITALVPPMVLLAISHHLDFTRSLSLPSPSSMLPPAMRQCYLDFWGRVDRIVEVAKERGVNLFVDAEHSFFQPAIDTLTLHLQFSHNKSTPFIHNTYQMYLCDKLGQLEEDLVWMREEGVKPALKLVRGAYKDMEWALADNLGVDRWVFSKIEKTHAAYNKALEVVIGHLREGRGGRLMVASHNEESASRAIQLLGSQPLEGGAEVVFGQLQGMADHMSYNLVDGGFPVYKYLPFGPCPMVF